MRHAVLSEMPGWRCSVIADAPLLALGHEVEALEPHRQGQIGGLEEGPGSDGGLAMAAVALLELSGVQLTAPVMGAVSTQKAVRPSPL